MNSRASPGFAATLRPGGVVHWPKTSEDIHSRTWPIFEADLLQSRPDSSINFRGSANWTQLVLEDNEFAGYDLMVVLAEPALAEMLRRARFLKLGEEAPTKLSNTEPFFKRFWGLRIYYFFQYFIRFKSEKKSKLLHSQQK